MNQAIIINCGECNESNSGMSFMFEQATPVFAVQKATEEIKIEAATQRDASATLATLFARPKNAAAA